MAPELAGWENFYVIVGSSAGALIGLQFVVIALVSTRSSAESRGVRMALRGFASPTIVHFASVLLLAAVLSIPRHTHASFTAVLLTLGIAGLGYMTWVTANIRRVEIYEPDLEDRIWHMFLPIAAYGVLVGAGAVTARSAAPYVVAASALLLLMIGVHNAWDSAAYMVANSNGE